MVAQELSVLYPSRPGHYIEINHSSLCSWVIHVWYVDNCWALQTETTHIGEMIFEYHNLYEFTFGNPITELVSYFNNQEESLENSTTTYHKK